MISTSSENFDTRSVRSESPGHFLNLEDLENAERARRSSLLEFGTDLGESTGLRSLSQVGSNVGRERFRQRVIRGNSRSGKGSSKGCVDLLERGLELEDRAVHVGHGG